MSEREEIDLPAGTVTVLLHRLADGDGEALDEIFPMLYAELRHIASGQRRRRVRGGALETTALIHEAYLRFAQRDRQLYSHREHFFAVAARAMRQILLDEAKKRLRAKRGGGVDHDSLDPEQLAIDQQAELMLSLHRGLEKLGSFHERARTVVECRFFGGLTEKETASALGVDERTVRRDWTKARAWLALELGTTDDPLVALSS
ncbi:MAG: ECF-type sigma factor [Acidobacteriota bacterium]